MNAPTGPFAGRTVRVSLLGVRPDEGNGQNYRYLALECLRSHCSRELGDHVQMRAHVVDEGSVDRVAEEISTDLPDLIAVSMPIGSVDRGIRLLSLIREATRTLPQVLVGNLVATNATQELLRALPEGSWAAIGEGEESLVGVLRWLRSGHQSFPEHVPGLARLGPDGALMRTPDEPTGGPIGDFDTEQWPSTLGLGGSALVEASRGCVSNCSFCSSRSMHPKGWRPRPIKAVLEELQALYETGVRWCFFVDDDFVGADWPRAASLAQAIHGVLPDMTFGSSFQARSFQTDDDAALLQILVECGLRSVLVGMESGCDTQLRRYGKASSTSMALTAIGQVRCHPDVELILGFILDPLMTLEELVQSAQFSLEHGLARNLSNPFNMLDVHAGTRYALRAEQARVIRSFDLNTMSYICEIRDQRLRQGLDRVAEFRQITDETESRIRRQYRALTRNAVSRHDPRDVAALGDALEEINELKLRFLVGLRDDDLRCDSTEGLSSAQEWRRRVFPLIGTQEGSREFA